MRKLHLLAALALSVSSLTANADALGIFVGGGAWNNDATGTFGRTGDPSIDLEADSSFSSTQDAYAWAAFEHFVPLIPNIRIEAASIGHDGSVNGVSLDNTDAILYYRLLDNWISFDFGINVRKLDGEFKIDTVKTTISETIPMLYLSAQFDLPFSGFSVGGDINTINFDGTKLQDIRLRAMYEMGVIGFEAGIKSTIVELQDIDNVTANMEFSGLFLGAFLHF